MNDFFMILLGIVVVIKCSFAVYPTKVRIKSLRIKSPIPRNGQLGRKDVQFGGAFLFDDCGVNAYLCGANERLSHGWSGRTELSGPLWRAIPFKQN
jgi:hypothetical protein